MSNKELKEKLELAVCPRCGEYKKIAWHYDIYNDWIKCRCLRCEPLRKGSKFPSSQMGPKKTKITIKFGFWDEDWVPNGKQIVKK